MCDACDEKWAAGAVCKDIKIYQDLYGQQEKRGGGCIDNLFQRNIYDKKYVKFIVKKKIKDEKTCLSCHCRC